MYFGSKLLQSNKILHEETELEYKKTTFSDFVIFRFKSEKGKS